MVRYLDDYERQCRRCKGGCAIEGMSGSIVCTGFNAMTNADRIRNMTDEEMAEVMRDLQCNACDWQGDCDEGDQCKSDILEWLKQEYADDGNNQDDDSV